MAYPLTSGMTLAAATTLTGGYFLSRRRLGRASSFVIAAIKTAIPLIFFLRYYDSTWNFLDDFIYEDQGKTMLEAGFNPWTALATQTGRSNLYFLSDGKHILYGWWNLLGQWCFGQEYWAPVFLNVLLTYVAALGLAKMLEDLEFPPAYVRGVFVLFLLHIELLVWSSFLNLKDIPVLAMTAIALRSTVMIAKSRGRLRTQLKHAAVVLAITFLFYYIRFYVPLLMVAAYAAWAFLNLSPLKRAVAFTVAAAVAVTIMRVYASDLGFIDLRALPFGIVRFPLTPRPWAIEPNYTFLIIPSVVQWALFIPCVAAAVSLWLTRPLARLPLLYLIVVILLFAASPELYGPRHRVQVLGLIVWLQFHAIWWPISVHSTSPRLLDEPSSV